MAAADERLDTFAGGGGDGSTLRLVWPQWQGAGTSSARSLAAEFPFDVARRGYAVGSAVLEAKSFPRQVMHLQQILAGLPLIGDRPTN
jgi:hypothetical protein